MMIDAFKPVRDLEAAICQYTGAPYAVAVNSCSMALLLAVAWHLRRFSDYQHVGHTNMPPPGTPMQSYLRNRPDIEIPKRTYLSVPMSIIHAGGRPTFRDEEWLGAYQLKPLPVWDSARWFTSDIYRLENWVLPPDERAAMQYYNSWADQHAMVCTSFHASKTLGDTQGGAILHDNPEADAWLRRARFDGRTEGWAPVDDPVPQVGWHAYMSPDVATRLLWRLARLPRHNAPLPNDDYPNLSTLEIFK